MKGMRHEAREGVGSSKPVSACTIEGGDGRMAGKIWARRERPVSQGRCLVCGIDERDAKTHVAFVYLYNRGAQEEHRADPLGAACEDCAKATPEERHGRALETVKRLRDEADFIEKHVAAAEIDHGAMR